MAHQKRSGSRSWLGLAGFDELEIVSAKKLAQERPACSIVCQAGSGRQNAELWGIGT